MQLDDGAGAGAVGAGGGGDDDNKKTKQLRFSEHSFLHNTHTMRASCNTKNRK
jgi:hypothetical protein